MNQAAIGSYIAKKRREKNLTQEQLAETLGVSNKTISKWENGKCMPDYSIIEQLCKELSVTLSELMDGEDAAEDSVRVYDDEQILDLLRRMQELERQKNISSCPKCQFDTLEPPLWHFGISPKYQFDTLEFSLLIQPPLRPFCR